MTDLDQQLATLLRTAGDDHGLDPRRVATAGTARGRRRRTRHRVGTASAVLALVGVAGAGLAVSGQDASSTAVDPVGPAAQPSRAPVATPTVAVPILPGDLATPTVGPAAQPSRAPVATPTVAVPILPRDLVTPTVAAPSRPRDLAVRAADLAPTFAALLPGVVTVSPAKAGETNPVAGFDPRANAATSVFPATEPGTGLLADLVWNGVPVRLVVAPTDPSLGRTPFERCVGGGEEGNGTCVATPDGGALQETTFRSGGHQVRSVTRYTPDRWKVTATANGPGTDPTTDQLEAVATSEMWFRAR